VEIKLISSAGTTLPLKLTETFSHSGIFKGKADVAFAGDTSRSNETDAVRVNYGDSIKAVYRAGEVERTVQVFKGANGDILPFTKRFKDQDIAVQTQFTIAEAYFEMAKKHRELAQEDLVRKEIAQGKKLLEEVIRDYPNTDARAQADYLLADLAYEGAADAADEEGKKKRYMEAVVRFSDIVATYPDSTYAPKAQFKKALIFEKTGQMDQACEEYVKLSYRYPDNELVAETIARLGQYFLTKGKEFQDKALAETSAIEKEKGSIQARAMFTTAAQVFGRLAQRFPDHKLAGKTTVLAAQCWMRAEELEKATDVFKVVIDEKKAEPDLIAQSMFWCGECYMKLKQPDLVNAYRMYKRLTWDYPESKWAKSARGRLTEDALARIEEKDSAQNQ
jgi:TolA-binding protein